MIVAGLVVVFYSGEVVEVENSWYNLMHWILPDLLETITLVPLPSLVLCRVLTGCTFVFEVNFWN